MISQIGEYSLSAALLCALVVLLAVVARLRLGERGPIQVARLATVGVGLFLTTAAGMLLYALLNDNFTLAYTQQHSERALALGYKIAAFWAGQEGSLLLWAWLLGLISLVLVVRSRKRDDDETVIQLGVMAVVVGFFALVMLYAANPFTRAAVPMEDGQGLNPLLQNLAMVFHPPLLFAGYATYTAPLAILVGALWVKRKDLGWLEELRPWAMVSWLFMTIGILLGAQWAYAVLGWGGYWAWDPVENASLLPWLTGTALLHSIMAWRKRGMFKRWTAALVIASFWLCIFGTYLTRSGIKSVHSFDASPLGNYFLVFMVLTLLGGVGLLLARLPMLRAEHPLEAILSREGMFLAGNVLLTVITLVVMIGTIWPLLSGQSGAEGVTVAGPFYNKVVLPMGLVLAVLMSTGPVLGYGAGVNQRSSRLLIMMGALAFLAVGVTLVLGITSIWALAVAATLAAVCSASLLDFGGAVAGLHRQVGWLPAIGRALVLAPKRWGAQVAHIGIALLILGVLGSSLYPIKDTFVVGAKESHQVGGYNVMFQGIEQVHRANHTAIVANLQVTNARGVVMNLKPERRFYNKGMDEQSASEIALRMGLWRDVYVDLAGWEDQGVSATLNFILNPLVNFIWIGGIFMMLGGLICLVPQRKGLGEQVAEHE